MDWITAIQSYTPQDPFEAAEKDAILNFAQNTQDVLLRKSTLAHATASGYVMNPARTRVLMIYHNIYNSWSWTGGHADGETDLFEVAKREVAEETGLTDLYAPVHTPLSVEILPVKAHIKNGGAVPCHLHLNVTYLFIAEETVPLRIKPDENSGVKWLCADALANDVTEPDMLQLYNKLTEKARKIQIV
ncbi:MAG: NUDIX hydrolase [Oscillospiraceae bacterium]|nr:NUDIX hydrolase [Oscillospiraceae bacterium]